MAGPRLGTVYMKSRHCAGLPRAEISPTKTAAKHVNMRSKRAASHSNDEAALFHGLCKIVSGDGLARVRPPPAHAC